MSTERRMDMLKSDTERLFSGVTGLPVTGSSMFPEVEELGNKPLQGPRDFTSVVDLGRHKDAPEYRIKTRIMLTDEWTHGEFLPDTSWQVDYLGETIFKRGGYVNTVGIPEYELRIGAVERVSRLLDHEYRGMVGGPTSDAFFGDFERCTLASLADEDSYVSNPYLAIMTHMKERQLPMPPILSKRPEINRAMERGEVDLVEKQLAAALVFEGASLDIRCQNHMQMEAEAIRRRVKVEANKRDPHVDLETAFPWAQVQEVNFDVVNNKKPVTVLVVDNDLYDAGGFTYDVVDALESDKRLGKTRLVTDVNLPNCIDLCTSGRIDVVLFDWQKPSLGEGIMYRGERNPFFDMTHGDKQAVLSINDDSIDYGLGDGRVLDQAGMDAETERLDIRNKWGEMIAAACRDMQVEPPPFFVVRNRSERQDLAKIIAQKLNMSIK